MSDRNVRLRGDVAVVTGSSHKKGESDGKHYEYPDRLTAVWIKAGGKWQVIALALRRFHTSRSGLTNR